MSGYKKTALNLSLNYKRKGVDWKHPEITVTRQCELLNLSKGGLYYQPVKTSGYNLQLMDEIDRQYLEIPFFGSRRMTAILIGKEYKD